MRLLERNSAGELCLKRTLLATISPNMLFFRTYGERDTEEAAFKDLVDGMLRVSLT
jgi:hypothetical protein